MGRQENVEIFQDTRRWCESNPVLVKAIRDASRNQTVIPAKKPYDEMPARQYDRPARLIVTRNRTFQAAAAYEGKKVCVLNFASATNPGGGVLLGASAQEEALCRCSTLYFSLIEKELWQKFYGEHRMRRNPLHNDDCIYTPGVVVFKSDTDMPEVLPEEEWYTVNVLTCAAPNLRSCPGNQVNPGEGDTPVQVSDEFLQKLHEDRLRRILAVAAANGNEVMILGAFGCGAFRNPPEVVAAAMKNVAKEYQRAFETIEFAVYCSPHDERNYRIFESTMR